MEKQCNIYQYLDYRGYLKDWYEEQKAKKPQFSYRFFSRQAGFSSPNFLKLVMDGDRNLTASSIVKFVDGLKLDREQADFFENLVHYTQAKSLKEKNVFYRKLSESRAYLELHQIERDSYDYFSSWHNVAVREMISLKNFRADPNWIACHLRPRISISEAQSALKRLEQLGLITKTKNKIEKAQGNLSTEKEVRSIAAANFQREMIKKGSESLELTKAPFRDVSSLTVAIKEDQIPQVKEMVQNFRRQLHAFLQDDKDAEVVYQINIQMFPLTETTADNDNKKKKK